MGFQNKASSIILDATLTDVGRRLMSQGKLEITKFSLGDDEVDYALGNRDTGEFLLDNAPPTLEAIEESAAAIIHGLIDYNRNDITTIPIYKQNTKLINAVKPFSGVIYLSANDETTEKLIQALDVNAYVLQTDKEEGNILLFESGIDNPDYYIEGSEHNQNRYIDNLDLYDKYVFAYVDSRFFQGLLSTSTTATEVRMDAEGNEKSDYQSLSQVKSITLDAPMTNYDTYYCTAVRNRIYDDDYNYQTNLSEFANPRANFLPLNFIINQKMRSRSNGSADVRYTKFGKTSQNVFGDGNLYDYVDTTVMIEGTSSTRTKQVRIRIIRFSGT
jgi:hypothetical protein